MVARQVLPVDGSFRSARLRVHGARASRKNTARNTYANRHNLRRFFFHAHDCPSRLAENP